ncbi:cation diffusion facilitator family transporter [Gordonia sp. 'Campus']|uniref:cation diffusion facilitator family transporter n=1 Tax=Gordonia sp. 'Campus' TaxID=2915824 RepID=UPI001EE4D319|nr:cation diffusion facilitator family transporter [Gordonia sp. 'Campus']
MSSPTEPQGESGGPSESFLTVIIAFFANLLIAVAKTGAAMLTGSASLVAEAAHSWADTGNEILLLIAERRARRPRDTHHPQGYGREAYIWSMFAAFGLFAVGAAVSVQHGITELISPEPATDYAVAYAVLGVAAILEGLSFVRSYQQARRGAEKRRIGLLRQVFRTSDPTLRAVFAEDAAALIGLAIAFVGVLLHQVTGSATYDALGSILVGILLGVVAIVLINQNRRFLLGQAVDETARQHVLRELLSHSNIDRVTYLHVEYTGPVQLFLVAAVDFTGDEVESSVAVSLRALETELERDPRIAEAVLTLSAPDDADLVPESR